MRTDDRAFKLDERTKKQSSAYTFDMGRFGNPDGPTRVGAFMFVLAVDEIDPTHNAFRFEGYGGLIWCDPRLAFDTEVEETEAEVYLDVKARAELERIWWPGVFMPTRLGAPTRTDESAGELELWSNDLNIPSADALAVVLERDDDEED